MSSKGRVKRFAVVALVYIMLLSFCTPVHATEQAQALRSCLENEPLYYSTTIEALQAEQNKDTKTFKELYDGHHVVLSGTIASKKNKELSLVDTKQNVCKIDTSESSLDVVSSGDFITVYGKIVVKVLSQNTYEIKAEKIDTNLSEPIPEKSYVFYPGDIYTESNTANVDMESVTFRVPVGWSRVSSPLTNNEVTGYQYYLNAISPQKANEKPEIFYIFYFDNKEYLTRPVSNASNSVNKKIEKKIIQNIIPEADEKATIKVERIHDANNNQLNYCLLNHKVEGYGDFDMEFVFKPDEKGITVMLYVHYPNYESEKHVKDVAYVIETVQSVKSGI